MTCRIYYSMEIRLKRAIAQQFALVQYGLNGLMKARTAFSKDKSSELDSSYFRGMHLEYLVETRDGTWLMGLALG